VRAERHQIDKNVVRPGSRRAGAGRVGQSAGQRGGAGIKQPYFAGRCGAELVSGDVELGGQRGVTGSHLASHEGDLASDCLVACGERSGALLKGNAGGGSGQYGKYGEGGDRGAAPPDAAELVAPGCGKKRLFVSVKVLAVTGGPVPGHGQAD